MKEPLNPRTEEEDEKPPFFRTWKEMYLFVILNLAITIIVFYLITIYF